MKTFGVDISLWQGDFDFAKAKKEGVKYAIIKCGEADFVDPKWERNYKAAKAVGMPVGAYFFSHATTEAAARKEADFFADKCKGKQLEYPLFIDAEHASLKALGKDKLTKVVTAFCKRLEERGYWSGLYTNWDWYNHYLDGAALAKRFSLWLAFWGLEMPKCDAQMWQFGGDKNFIRSNKIAGVVCDQDYAYKDLPKLIKAKGLNGFAAAKPTPAPAPKPAATLKLGDKIKLTSTALVYGATKKFAPWVYSTTYKIVGITDNGNRIAFATLSGEVVGATDKKYVKKV